MGGAGGGRGAALAVFPEYGAMELASLDPATMGDLAGSIETVSALLPRVDALHAELAARHGMHILAASAPRKDADGRLQHRAAVRAERADGRAGQAGDDPLRARGVGNRGGRGAQAVRDRA
jgi:predicted amidohydrolase